MTADRLSGLQRPVGNTVPSTGNLRRVVEWDELERLFHDSEMYGPDGPHDMELYQ